MSKRALLIVDMQNDFVRPDGALYVPSAEELIGPIQQKLDEKWDLIVFTQDWHPESHHSFSSFPPHCIQNTVGAEIITELRHNRSLPQIFFQKGFMTETDSLSAFSDDKGNCTGLCAILRTNGISDVYVCGVATEYCVKQTAIGSVTYGFNTFVYSNLIKPFDPTQSDSAIALLEKAGVHIVH